MVFNTIFDFQITRPALFLVFPLLPTVMHDVNGIPSMRISGTDLRWTVSLTPFVFVFGAKLREEISVFPVIKVLQREEKRNLGETKQVLAML